MNLRLRPPRPADEPDVLAAQDELERDGFVFAFRRPGQSFAEFVQMVDDHRHGRALTDGWVESTWLLAEVDGTVVGRSSIRFELNEFLLAEGGHIGYAVRPGHRRRGYATEILRQSLVVARAGGVGRALVTCDDDNTGSVKAIEANGGVLENLVDVDGASLRRYWIDSTRLRRRSRTHLSFNVRPRPRNGTIIRAVTERRRWWPGCYTGAVTDSYFQSAGAGVSPLPHAHAPWGDDMMHGRLLGGLAARALEAEHGTPGWRAARLTVDLFRPAAMALVEIDVRPVRGGRRLKVIDALMRCDGHDVGRATAVFLAESDEPPGRIWRPEQEPWPDPDSIETSEAGSTDHDGWWFRVVRGGFGTGEQTRIWTRETTLLVDDEPVSPFVRTALSGDIACPIANSSDRGLHYINADYTMLIGRYPVGEWVGLDVAQQIDADGISMGSATLVDATGPFATSGGVSLARPPMATTS